MSRRKQTISYTIILIVGLALCIAGGMKYLDEFWSGMGGGLVAVVAIKLVLEIRGKKDPKYAKKREIENNDEGNRYLADRAKSWTVSVSVLVLGILGIILRVGGLITESQMCFYTVCGMMVIYWISYIILRKTT